MNDTKKGFHNRFISFLPGRYFLDNIFTVLYPGKKILKKYDCTINSFTFNI